MVGDLGGRGREGRWWVGRVEEGEGRWWVGRVEEEEREDGGWVGWKRKRGKMVGGWVEEEEKKVTRITFMFYRYMITN